MSSKITVNGTTIEAENANILVRDNRVYVDGKEIGSFIAKNSIVKINGDVNNLKVDGAAEVSGTVHGNVDAGGSVNCGNVEGNVDAGGSVSAKNVSKNIDAGGSVSIKN